jgi:hypothetical protein
MVLDPPRRHRLLVAIVLLGVTVLLLVTDLHRLASSILVRVLAPWMHAQVVAGTREPPASIPLQEQVYRLNALAIELRRQLAEYEDIHAANGLLPPLRTVRARILSHAGHGRHYLEIDAGAVDGIGRDDPVIAGWSLVGLIAGEQSRQSLVQLLTDVDCRVPAAIYRPPTPGEDEAGTREGRWIADCLTVGTGRHDLLAIDCIEPATDVPPGPGLQVLTSGIDGRIPPGLVIGTTATTDPAAAPTGGTGDRIAVVPLRPWGSYHSLLVLTRNNAAAP